MRALWVQAIGEAAMAKYILVVPSAPSAGQEHEYNRWYDEQHLADVCAVPGFVGSRRFEAMPSSPQQPPEPYLAIYEIEADNPDAAIAELNRRAAAGEMAISPALDVTTAKMWLYRAR